MRGGRGYNHRGGGGGRGGSNYRGSSSSSYRGSSSSSYRGSGGRSNFNSSYNSRSSYNNSYDSRNRDRNMSRHDRHNDHKRSYRDSRDRSPDRKRSRHEDSRMSSSYSSSYRRNDSSSRSSRQTPPPPSVRSSSGPHRRDDSSHRHSSVNDSMGPPKSLPPRGGRPIIRSRGGGGGGPGPSSNRPNIRSNVRIIRRGRDTSDLQIMRRKLLLANQRDRARRIKIARLTSSLRNRQTHRDVVPLRKPVRRTHDKKDDDSKKDGDEEDADKSKSKDGDNDEEEVEGDGEKGDEVKVKKESKEKREVKQKEVDEAECSDVEEKHDKDDDDDDSKSKHDMMHRRPKRTFIKLACPHCRTKCLTFKEYSTHLYGRSHKLAMRRLALRQKTQLSQMRMNQRSAQRDIEESLKGETEDCKPQYCPLCRLNYRQPKAKHQLSESHRNMKKFLMPYCSTCHIAFKSPMMYETHRCSLDHIRRRARNNESANSDSSDGEKEVDLTNFMTVDSVGEIDGDDTKIEGEEGKEKINVGADHVKKTEALFCDLCQYFIPVKGDEEAVIRKHCSLRSHLKAFVRYKDDQTLRQEAERIQRKQKETKEKIKKEADEKAAASVAGEEKAVGENAEDAEEGGEDKIWEDVDKDLGDLLREVGPDGENDDDEEDGSVLNINIERFDRFKNSENQKKDLNGDIPAEETEEEKANKPEAKESNGTPAKKSEKKTTDVAKTEEKAVEAN